MKVLKLLLFFALISSASMAQGTVPSAEQILAPAFEKAKTEKKNVIVIFHASWCGWCRKMDAAMNDKLVRKFFTDNYITVHLTVDESTDKKNLENSGASDIKKKYKGHEAGLPFWLIMAENRTLLADSYIRKEGMPMNEPGENIGCPATEEEVRAFINVLKKTSRLNEIALKAIEKRFRQNEVK
jgi:thiol-disulfide isomerase/thioredoxin